MPYLAILTCPCVYFSFAPKRLFGRSPNCCRQGFRILFGVGKKFGSVFGRVLWGRAAYISESFLTALDLTHIHWCMWWPRGLNSDKCPCLYRKLKHVLKLVRNFVHRTNLFCDLPQTRQTTAVFCDVSESSCFAQAAFVRTECTRALWHDALVATIVFVPTFVERTAWRQYEVLKLGHFGGPKHKKFRISKHSLVFYTLPLPEHGSVASALTSGLGQLGKVSSNIKFVKAPCSLRVPWSCNVDQMCWRLWEWRSMFACVFFG